MRNMIKSAAVALMAALLSAFSVSAQQMPNLDSLTREETLNVLKIIASAINSSDAQAKINNLTGQEMNANGYMEGNNLVMEMTNDELWVESPEMALFSYAVNIKGGDKEQSVRMLAKLLENVDGNLIYIYRTTDGHKTELTLTPALLNEILTKPVDQLPIDRNKLLNEMVSSLNDELNNDKEPEVVSQEALLNGQYLTIRQIITTSLEDMEKADSSTALRKYLLSTLAAEFAKAPAMINGMINVMKEFKIKGIKYDISDMSGCQQVYNISWDELSDAINNTVNGDESSSELEMLLTLIDDTMNPGFREAGMLLTQTHSIIDNNIVLTLGFDTDLGFSMFSEAFDEDFTLSVYADLFKDIFVEHPELESLMLITGSPNNVGEVIIVDREKIINYVEPEEEPGLIDEDGRIHT